MMKSWHDAAMTSVGFFWMALWAFAMGYLVSSIIQTVVTRHQMQQQMGEDGPRAMALGGVFGFISSSCSFAALSTTRALFRKGAGLAPSMAFLLASTNLVIELGFVIAIFLSWHFVVGEYVGGVLLILWAWLFVRLTRPKRLVQQAREHMGDPDDADGDGESAGWRQILGSRDGWAQISQKYVMEWKMVWQDVLIGFTVAGLIKAMVPTSWFQLLFPGTGGAADLSFWQVLVQTLVGPIAAFATFIGSMGNIPLAGVLYGQGVSFAGVMAFIFSDLVVLPVLRINAQYYGWKMALYMLGLLLSGLVAVSLTLHYSLAALNLLPQGGLGGGGESMDLFSIDYGFWLNLLFIAVSAGLIWLARRGQSDHGEHDHDEHEEHDHDEHDHDHHDHDHGSDDDDGGGLSWIMPTLCVVAVVWLLGGLVLPPLLGG